MYKDDQIKLWRLGDKPKPSAVTAQREVIESYLRAGRSISIDGYKCETISLSVAKELYALLLDTFTEEKVRRLVIFEYCNGKVFTALNQALDDYVAELKKK